MGTRVDSASCISDQQKLVYYRKVWGQEVLVHGWFYLIPDWSTADLALGNIAIRQHCCYSRLILLQFDARPFVV